MEDTLKYLVFIAFTFLLLLLRFDAYRFGTAEYYDENAAVDWHAWPRRLAWYALGVALVLLAYRLYAQPISQLHLDLGTDRERALIAGLAFGALGTVAAFGFAWLRYRRFRLPPARQYVGATINAIATAFIDEALFRGIILGLLLTLGWPSWLAIGFESILYGLATRLGSSGRSWGMLLISIGIGVIGGVLVIQTGGIGAAILGHAITRFAIFLATGHAGVVRPQGAEPEEEVGQALPPSGWEFVGDDSEPPPSPWYGPRSG